MCQKRNSRKVTLKNGRVIKVDSCLKTLIESLQQSAVPFTTLSCCCGHDRYPTTIVVKIDGDVWVHDIKIPRKCRFYKKDQAGFYYIPELCSIPTLVFKFGGVEK